MTYDPTKDEPIYSRREVEEAIREAVAYAIDRTIQMRWKELIGFEVHGHWERGQVYAQSSIVYFDGHQWVATTQTASEPGCHNPAWRRVSLSVLGDSMTDTTTPRM